MHLIDLRGRKFGRLTVLHRTPRADKKFVYWHCKCQCGNELDVYGGSLRRGATVSCGCNSRTTHGMTHTAIYRVWHQMRQRCENKNNQMYAAYGGRGIKVCKRWQQFENFFSDMGEPPFKAYLDRINNDGDYKPSNCRWITSAQSARNTTRNVMLTHKGMTMCLSDWAIHTGISRATLNGRLTKGWNIDKLLDTPAGKHRKKESKQHVK